MTGLCRFNFNTIRNAMTVEGPGVEWGWGNAQRQGHSPYLMGEERQEHFSEEDWHLRDEDWLIFRIISNNPHM